MIRNWSTNTRHACRSAACCARIWAYWATHQSGSWRDAPQKAPKRELTFLQKLYKQLISPLRVVIEHDHSGIKRLRMVADPLRLRGEWVRDTVIVVACTIGASVVPTGPTFVCPPANVSN